MGQMGQMGQTIDWTDVICDPSSPSWSLRLGQVGRPCIAKRASTPCDPVSLSVMYRHPNPRVGP